jgi:predicted Rossmann fold nucleotide-binding protein DprA/Smf involved in DNA uptake
MRTIIAGSRQISDITQVEAAMRNNAAPRPTVVLSGCAPGVDTLGERWAVARGIPIERYPAKWDKYPETAGRLRNREMAHAAEALVAVWDGKSSGTLHMIEAARQCGLVVHIWRVS